MFIKKIANTKKGKTYLTYRLVKSVWKDNKSVHQTLLNLGSLPLVPIDQHKALLKSIQRCIDGEKLLFDLAPTVIDEVAQSIYKKLIVKELNKVDSPKTNSISTKKDKQSINTRLTNGYHTVDLESFESLESKEIGGVWVCKQAIEELGLNKYLEQTLAYDASQIQKCLLALIGRLLYPSSERKTALWLNENSAAIELYPSSRGSLTVSRDGIMQGALLLNEQRRSIEKHLNHRIKNIFNLESKFILYDLTNIHFEGAMQGYEKANFGKNKQKRNDCKQVSIGLAVDEYGFCEQSNFYKGNISEPSTFLVVIQNAKKQCKTTRPVLVIDAGIATEENLELALAHGCDYICVSRAQHQDLRVQVIEQELVSFTNEKKQTVRAKVFTQLISYSTKEKMLQHLEEQKGIRPKKKLAVALKTNDHTETIMYVTTPKKKLKEQAIFEKKRIGFEKELDKIRASLTKPKGIKEVEKVNQRIGRARQKYALVNSLYDIKVIDNKGVVTQITYSYNEDNNKQKSQGTYFIRTSLNHLNKEELLWKAYRTINEVEATFRVLKSDLDIRPIFHSKTQNIEAHLNLAILAYFVVSFIRHKLKSKDIHHSWSEIRRILSTQKCSIQTVKDNKNNKILFKSCSRPNQKLKDIIEALNFKPMPFYTKKTILNS